MNKSCRYLLLEILIGLAILASDGSGQNIVVLRHESVPSLDTNVHVRNILRNIISGQTFEALSDSTTGVSQLNNIPPGNYQLTTLQRDHFLKIQDTLEVTGNIDISNQTLEDIPTGSTMITFSLPRTSDVQLRIFNTLGQEVATLATGKLDAGEHSVSFQPNQLASGLYFYRLVTGSGLSKP